MELSTKSVIVIVIVPQLQLPRTVLILHSETCWNSIWICPVSKNVNFISSQVNISAKHRNAIETRLDERDWSLSIYDEAQVQVCHIQRINSNTKVIKIKFYFSGTFLITLSHASYKLIETMERIAQ